MAGPWKRKDKGNQINRFTYPWPIQWERSQDKRLCSKGRTRWSRRYPDASSKVCPAPSSMTWTSSGRILCWPRARSARRRGPPARRSSSSWFAATLSVSRGATKSGCPTRARTRVQGTTGCAISCATIDDGGKKWEDNSFGWFGDNHYIVRLPVEPRRIVKIVDWRRGPTFQGPVAAARAKLSDQVDELYRGHDRWPLWSREVVKLE